MFRISALILALLCGAAQADNLTLMGVGAGNPATYTGPGDLVSFTFWAGLRAYKASIVSGGTQTLVNVRNTATSESCDIVVSATGGLGLTSNCSGSSNGTAAATFCAGGGGSCATTKAYDQTGGGRDASQATAANQPPLVFTGCGVVPNNCWSWTTNGTQLASSGNFTPATGLVSFFVVANRISANGTTADTWIRENGTNNRFRSINSAGTGWELVGGSSGSFTTSNGAINTWHAATSVLNGASSVTNLDGTETTGTATGNTTAGALSIVANGSGSTPSAEQTEAGFLDNSAISSGNRTSLCQNAQAYWGTGNFGATC